jgi:UDP-4-amino-4,6-dideoxy-N-acetyl-beta-L-altrosamine N-acetyltransferase
MQDNTPVLEQQNVKLRPIEECDTPNILKWRNSEIVKSNLFGSAELCEETHKNWLTNHVAAGKCVQFIIHAEDTPIGTIFLKNIDRENSKAEFGIFIGEKEAHGKGYGTIAAKLITDFGFRDLALNKIYLLVFEDNKGAIKSYKKVGFTEEGLLRQEYYKNGRFQNVLQMAVFKDGFPQEKI